MIELPVCRWRREPCGPGRHACVSPKLVVGANGVPDSKCGECYCRDHPPPARPRGLCLHLGRRLGVVACGPCSTAAGRPVELPEHACALHGRCTIAAAAPGRACCATCPDHAPHWARPGAGRVRHLTYHCYPAGPAWEWNLGVLRDHLSLFNGRRVVSVATSPATASLADVRGHFGDLPVELVEARNDPTLREMASFAFLLESVSAYAGEEDVTFYGHAKGASSEQWAPAVREWTATMYRALLSHWPAVRRALADRCVVGILRRMRHALPAAHSGWHYSGSFRWTRNRDLYSRDWRNLDPDWCGSESYPSKHFRAEETACLHSEWGRGGLGLYHQQTWDEWASASAATWEAEHAEDRETPLLVTVILTSCRQADLVHDAIGSVRGQTSDSWQLLIMDAGPLADAGAFDRYAADARVEVYRTGETEALRSAVAIQSWAINECWRRRLVRGDLVLHLSDDDYLSPTCIADWIAVARGRPDQSAWYGSVERYSLHPDGSRSPIRPLVPIGVGGPGLSLDCRADGMQVCHRRAARMDWPEQRQTAPHADGVWMDRLSAQALIHPAAVAVGIHRHTPLSTFTRPPGCGPAGRP